MNSEGRGIVAPAPYVMKLERGELLAVKEISADRASARRYADRGDAWGRGHTGSMRVKNVGDLRSDETPIFVGTLGEYAAVSYINKRFKREAVSVDSLIRSKGDGGVDIRVSGRTIDVKCRTKPGVSLIRAAWPNGNRVPFAADIYLFCQYAREVQDQISLLGWAWRSCLESLELVPARRGDHLNVEVADEMLNPMNALISALQRKAG